MRVGEPVERGFNVLLIRIRFDILAELLLSSGPVAVSDEVTRAAKHSGGVGLLSECNIRAQNDQQKHPAKAQRRKVLLRVFHCVFAPLREKLFSDICYQHFFNLFSLTVVCAPVLVDQKCGDDLGFLHSFFDRAHVLGTRVIGQVRDVDQEWFQIGQ